MNYITFDIETYSPGDLQKIDTSEFRASVTGAYISWTDQYVAFMEDDTKTFIELLKQCDLVVGYNHRWFDLPVLNKYADFDLLSLPCYDIMLEFEKIAGFKIKLDSLVSATIGQHKTDSYEVYKHYHKEKKWAPLIDYCMNDVRLTEQLFRRALKGEPIMYMDLLEKKEVILAKPTSGKKVEIQEENHLFL
jgi:DEAD/DEAH box helicase domain-containing protein